MSIKFSVLFCLSCTILLTASHVHVDPRDTITAPSIINTTVIDQSGKDVSSSFTRKVFYYNTTMDAINESKDAQDKVVRILDTCGNGKGSFIESHCSYKGGVLGSIRQYSYKCWDFKRGVRNKKYGIKVETVYAGSCTDREICVNGRMRSPDNPDGPGMTAFCINMDAFSAANEPGHPDLSGMTLTTLLTSSDMETPLGVNRFDVDTDLTTSTGQEGKVQGQECLNCTSLTTEELPSSVELFGFDIWAWLEFWTLGLGGTLLLFIFG